MTFIWPATTVVRRYASGASQSAPGGGKVIAVAPALTETGRKCEDL